MSAPPPVPQPRRRRETVADIRRAKARRRRRRRITAIASIAAFTLVMIAAIATLAVASGSDGDRIADGVSVGGIDVGGLNEAEATELLEREIGAPSRKPIKVRVAGKTARLSADDAKVSVDIPGAVDRAVDAGQRGNFISRGWRELTGGQVHADEPAAISVDKKAVARFVNRVEKTAYRPAVNADLSLEVTDVAVSPAKNGRKLTGSKALERRIVNAFEQPGSKRKFKGKTTVIKPSVTEDDVWERNPTIITVAHDAQVVRVFKNGKVATTYRVAVGQDEFPTPHGRFSVDRKEKNPVWNVPNSEWAGSMAGQTIPGGDPRNPLVARWVGISGPVGFHGTKDLGSIGSRASHGCVRMRPADVIDLYDRVEVGTPILIA